MKLPLLTPAKWIGAILLAYSLVSAFWRPGFFWWAVLVGIVWTAAEVVGYWVDYNDRTTEVEHQRQVELRNLENTRYGTGTTPRR